MITVKRTDLTPSDLECLELRKAILLAQARLLCQVYEAGQLREWLDQLKGNIDDSQYVSHSNQPQHTQEENR
jgi:hypothetical protein